MSGKQLVLVKISLSAEITDEDFENFMEQNVLPEIEAAVEMGPTRMGAFEGADLWGNSEGERDYIWTVLWNGLPGVHPAIVSAVEKLKSRGIYTSITRYNHVSSLPSSDNS